MRPFKSGFGLSTLTIEGILESWLLVCADELEVEQAPNKNNDEAKKQMPIIM